MDSGVVDGGSRMAGFDRQELDIHGIKTVVYSAGDGDPLVFLHGANSFTGFDFARDWAKSYRVILPYHPGFGESGDDPRIDSMQDYVLHYLDLFDALGLERFHLVGFSFGGWLAAEFAILQNRRIRKLVLVAPAGLGAPDQPKPDPLTIPEKDLAAYLAHDPRCLTRSLPSGHDLDFLTLRYREMTALTRIIWDRPSGSRKLAQWLHRVTMPSLLVWGQEDRMIPPAHAEIWARHMPHPEIALVAGAGHLVLDEAPEVKRTIAQFLG